MRGGGGFVAGIMWFGVCAVLFAMSIMVWTWKTGSPFPWPLMNWLLWCQTLLLCWCIGSDLLYKHVERTVDLDTPLEKQNQYVRLFDTLAGVSSADIVEVAMSDLPDGDFARITRARRISTGALRMNAILAIYGLWAAIIAGVVWGVL